MSSIASKALYAASIVASAWTLALAPPLGAAPAADEQGGATGRIQQGAGAMQGGMDTMQHGGGMGTMQHDGMDMMQHHQEMMAKMHPHGGLPKLPGQDAFGAIGEIVALLEADSKTDWSKVDLEALRAHLIDMNEVTLNATATPKPVDGGIQIAVTGTGRALAAIQRMVPMHAAEIDGQRGWSVKSSPLADGVLLTVTSADPKETVRIRALGFAGVMVTGSHHQAHHLAIARGEPMHASAAETEKRAH